MINISNLVPFRVTEEALQHNKYGITVFLDFERAPGLLWIKCSLCKLHFLQVSGNMFGYIRVFLFFLENHKFQIRFHPSITQTFILSNGMQQGSTVSPTLFNIIINDPNIVLYHRLLISRLVYNIYMDSQSDILVRV